MQDFQLWATFLSSSPFLPFLLEQTTSIHLSHFFLVARCPDTNQADTWWARSTCISISLVSPISAWRQISSATWLIYIDLAGAKHTNDLIASTKQKLSAQTQESAKITLELTAICSLPLLLHTQNIQELEKGKKDSSVWVTTTTKCWSIWMILQILSYSGSSGIGTTGSPDLYG